MDELRRTTAESYGASGDGDANTAPALRAIPCDLLDLSWLKAEMDAAGFGSHIIDLATGKVIDRPAMPTPMDDALREEGEMLQ